MKVAIVKCNSYKREEVEAAVKKALDIVGIPKEKELLLKPNCLRAAKTGKALSTHPEVVRAVGKLLLENGKKVEIGEASGQFGNTDEALEICGINKVGKELGVRVRNLDNEEAELKNGLKTTKTKKGTVSLAKLKTHSLTKYTGAVKNLYGLVAGKTKTLYHARYPTNGQFSEMLIRLYEQKKPVLCVMDAVLGMEGNGPGLGTPKKTNIILASHDALALDYVASRIIGYKKEEIEILKIAERKGLFKPDDVEIIGEEPRVPYKRPSSVIKGVFSITDIVKKIIYKEPYPKITQNCIGCGACAKNCPKKVISIEKKAVIDYSGCIRCFCCHEICPHNAIDIIREPKKWARPIDVLIKKAKKIALDTVKK